MTADWFNSTIVKILRWILFLPLSLVLAWLLSEIYIVVSKWAISRAIDPETFIIKHIYITIKGIIFSFAFFWISNIMIPKFKKVVLISLYILYSIYTIWLLWLIYMGEYYIRFNMDSRNKIDDVLQLTGTLIFCIIILYLAIKSRGLAFVDEFIELNK